MLALSYYEDAPIDKQLTPEYQDSDKMKSVKANLLYHKGTQNTRPPACNSTSIIA